MNNNLPIAECPSEVQKYTKRKDFEAVTVTKHLGLTTSLNEEIPLSRIRGNFKCKKMQLSANFSSPAALKFVYTRALRCSPRFRYSCVFKCVTQAIKHANFYSVPYKYKCKLNLWEDRTAEQ